MPYASPELLAAAADDLAGSHALTIVTIPAILHALQNGEGVTPGSASLTPMIPGFGTKQERWALENFRLDEGESPYLAVWAKPPAFVKRDYAGSTLQRQRTREPLGLGVFDVLREPGASKSSGTSLRLDAAQALQSEGAQPVSRFSLAVWLARHVDVSSPEDYLDWFDANVRVADVGLQDFYKPGVPAYVNNLGPMVSPLWGDEPSNDDILDAIGDVVAPTMHKVATSVPRLVEQLQEVEVISDEPASPPTVESPDPLDWTRGVCSPALRGVDVPALTQSVLDILDSKNIELPEAETLVRRCVTALLVGHLVLQGPPGTGKTTLARALASAFDVALQESTATSEWSPYQVVGGLRPGRDGSLQPAYGYVTAAVLACAEVIRDELAITAAEGAPQGTWLLIDEFNRADIDKAIGSLYTVLSSVNPDNLLSSPLDLWFEQPGRQLLWVPARFRIIASMNDLDTSFVNLISQGLTRRFQFISVGVPDASDIDTESVNSLATAHRWLTETYGESLAVPSLPELTVLMAHPLDRVRSFIPRLRQPQSGAAGWPVGTAQIVDLLRLTALQVVSGIDAESALDWAIADRIVPQMTLLDEPQLRNAVDVFSDLGLNNAARAVQQLADPHST